MGRENEELGNQSVKSNARDAMSPADAVNESVDTRCHQQCILPPALSKEQAMKYWGYSDSALKMRRHRHWKEGIHYGKEPGGAIVYYKEEIDSWRR